MAETQISLHSFLRQVASRATAADVFGSVACTENRLECAARASGAPAFYRVGTDAGRLWVSLVTADRWLSQSIEADLVHTGDSIGELIEEELVDLGGPRGRVPFEHFRSEDKLFTFRTPIGTINASGLPGECEVEQAERMLLAYEACFRRLGDMNAQEEPE